MHALKLANLVLFLSTLSLRRATLGQFQRVFLVGYFYPRSPCGERLISIVLLLPQIKFLSTLSLRRATSNESSEHTDNGNFYPRSPCGERRLFSSVYLGYMKNFYPRSPCGERPCYSPALPERYNFYPRSPCGERPRKPCAGSGECCISIHALLAESDGDAAAP